MAASAKEWEWIIARLAGDISPENDKLLIQWIDQSDANRTIYEEALKVWQSSTLKLEIENISVEQDWERLKTRIARENEKPFGNTVSMKYVWMAVAAGIISCLLFAYYLSERRKIAVPLEESIVINSPNEVLTVYLSDSSKVWLNTASTLSYTTSFGKSRREVTLLGEAYFDVKKDTVHPFQVGLNNSIVTVVGTSFNVKQTDATTEVIVAQGKVHLENSESKGEVFLTKGEKGISSANSVTEQANSDPAFGNWRKRNNPTYIRESNKPAIFLTEQHTWKKNPLNQTTIEGFIKNSATLASYKNIILKITYLKPGGKETTTLLRIDEVIHPGERIPFRKKLLDIFTQNQNIRKIEFKNIELVP